MLENFNLKCKWNSKINPSVPIMGEVFVYLKNFKWYLVFMCTKNDPFLHVVLTMYTMSCGCHRNQVIKVLSPPKPPTSIVLPFLVSYKCSHTAHGLLSPLPSVSMTPLLRPSCHVCWWLCVGGLFLAVFCRIPWNCVTASVVRTQGGVGHGEERREAGDPCTSPDKQ